jgi:hypothetical protein
MPAGARMSIWKLIVLPPGALWGVGVTMTVGRATGMTVTAVDTDVELSDASVAVAVTL